MTANFRESGRFGRVTSWAMMPAVKNDASNAISLMCLIVRMANLSERHYGIALSM
jgi:hypothetical protein